MGDELISRLTDDLKPCCPCCPYATSIKLVMLTVLAATIFLIVIGLRPDLDAVWMTFMPYWKSGTFILMGLGALLTACRLGLPGRGVGLIGPTFMALGATGLIAFVAGALSFGSAPQVGFGTLFLAGREFCLFTVTTLGFILLGVEFLILRRLAFMRPALAGGLLGMSSGALAAAAYAWHCVNDQPLYVGAWYTLPVIALGLIGTLAGKRFLRL